MGRLGFFELGFDAGLGALLFDPATEIGADVVDEAGDVFVAAGLEESEVFEEAGLVTEDVEAVVEGLELGELAGGVADLDEAFEEIVEAADEAFPEGEFVVAGELVEDGDVPANEVVGLLDDGEVSGHGEL